MAAENLMAHSPDQAEKGRAGGWYSAGNLGGQGVGGGLALWIAEHSSAAWLPGAVMAALFMACCLALPFIREPPQHHRELRYLYTLRSLARDLWATVRSRSGYLALLICFLPIGSGAAAALWSAVADDWHATSDTVALVNGVLGGVVSALGCVVGGYFCDRMDRKFAYALYGVFLAAVALTMAAAPRTETMFVVFTLVYAFVNGFNYASLSAVALEVIGRGAAATKYNVFASLSNVPVLYMVLLDGWGHAHWKATGFLIADALPALVAVTVFFAVTALTAPRLAQPA